MEKFTTIRSVVAPLPMKDVDTDLIIPAQFLTSTLRDGFGQNVFRRLRDGDPNFVLSRPEYSRAEILAVGPNFGCGSSREHAVWALLGAGFRAVLGTTFADIFSANAAKNGLLLVSLSDHELDQIWDAPKPVVAEVSLEQQQVILPTGVAKFEYDPFRRTCLLEGLDDLDYLVARRDAIRAHFSEREGQ